MARSKQKPVYQMAGKRLPGTGGQTNVTAKTVPTVVPAKTPRKTGKTVAKKGVKAVKPGDVRQPRKRRRRNGMAALKEIRTYQKSADLLIPKTRFRRVVREISETVKRGTRWRKDALDALQEAAELAMAELFEATQLCAVHAKRITIQAPDMQLARKLSSFNLI